MAKYKPYSSAQGQLIPVMFAKQIQPSTFEFTLNHLIDHELDTSYFNNRFKSDETGIPAFDPRILLKISCLPILGASSPAAGLSGAARITPSSWPCPRTVDHISPSLRRRVRVVQGNIQGKLETDKK